MRLGKSNFWAGIALQILLLGIAAIFSLLGWNASGIGSGEVNAGALAWCAELLWDLPCV